MKLCHSIFIVGLLALLGFGCSKQLVDSRGEKETASGDSEAEEDDDFKKGQASVPVSGINLATFDNTRVRCRFTREQSKVYEVDCRAVTVDANGNERAATGVAKGVRLDWDKPALVTGGGTVRQCEASEGNLQYMCAIELETERTLTTYRYDLGLRSGRQSRTASTKVDLPYSVGVAAGFVPSTPFLFDDQTREETAKAFGLTAAKVPQLGFQNFAFPADKFSFFGATSGCEAPDGKSFYFSHGLFIYRVENGIVSVYAGTGRFTTEADFSHRLRAYIKPVRLACVKDGLVIAEFSLNRVSRLYHDGRIESLAGNGVSAYTADGAQADQSSIEGPFGVAIAPNGDVVFAERNGDRIRRIDSEGRLRTIAGTGQHGYSGDGGQASAATFKGIISIAYDNLGNLFVADQTAAVVRKIDGSGVITTIAGTGTQRWQADDEEKAQALAEPVAVAVDAQRNVFVAEFFRGIKKIAPDGSVSQVTGGVDIGESATSLIATERIEDRQKLAAYFANEALFTGAGARLYGNWADGIKLYSGDNRIVLGAINNPGPCGVSEPAVDARFFEASAVDFDLSGNLVVADWASLRSDQLHLRQISSTKTGPVVQSLIGCEGNEGLQSENLLSVANYIVNSIGGLKAYDEHKFLFVNTNRASLYEIDTQQNTIKNLVGNGQHESEGDGGDAALATLNTPRGLAIGPDKSVYLVDDDGGRLRKIDASTKVISTIAGTGDRGFGGDGGLAILAQIGANTVAVDQDENIYLSDYYNNRIRRIDAETGRITTIAGTGAVGTTLSADDASVAPIGPPASVAVARDGRVFFVDAGNAQVKVLTPRTDLPNRYALKTLFGHNTNQDCGIGVTSGLAKSAADVETAIKDSLSIICPGVPRTVTVKDSCDQPKGQLRIAITQAFHEYSNVIQIVEPCDAAE